MIGQSQEASNVHGYLRRLTQDCMCAHFALDHRVGDLSVPCCSRRRIVAVILRLGRHIKTHNHVRSQYLLSNAPVVFLTHDAATAIKTWLLGMTPARLQSVTLRRWRVDVDAIIGETKTRDSR